MRGWARWLGYVTLVPLFVYNFVFGLIWVFWASFIGNESWSVDIEVLVALDSRWEPRPTFGCGP